MSAKPPLTPAEYALVYQMWQDDRRIFDALAECNCKHCVICCIVRPHLLQIEYTQQEDEEIFPEDDYIDDETDIE